MRCCPRTIFRPLLACAMLLLGLALGPASVRAEPADVAAASRGVVRVVIVGSDGRTVFPISHGTGFAVAPDKILTNAHVVAEAVEDDGLRIGIVPSEAGEAVYARIVAYSPQNDLALVQITDGLRLPPLTIAGSTAGDGAEVTSVGYPMNVDRAQGLAIGDIFRSQPAVKSRGFVSGARPSRQFDTILHTAPIARGNSGGPLLDNCGRVLGVNSFGAESDGVDGEFYFAVSTREILPFLRANAVTARVNGMPCRSLAELDAQESARAASEARKVREQAARDAAKLSRRRGEAREGALLQILSEREDHLALATILLVAALGIGGLAFYWHEGGPDDRQRFKGAAAIAGLALAGSVVSWITRPGWAAIEERADAAISTLARAQVAPSSTRANATDIPPSGTGGTAMICTVDLQRSRITGDSGGDIPLQWSDDGCVNGRTQYGLSNGRWSRLFVPNEEDVVSRNSYDPAAREYRVERYLLGRTAIAAARQERSGYKAPACGGGADAGRELGTRQAAIEALLPDQPNERLIYDCR